MTNAFSVAGVYEHKWNPNWKTAVQGGYVSFKYDGAATQMICQGAPGVASTGSLTMLGGTWQAGSSCNPNVSWAQIGTRTIWNPHPDLDIGLEVMYTQLQQNNSGTISLGASGALPSGVYNFGNIGIWSSVLRIQRNFLY
jgi:hypothetical protein